MPRWQERITVNPQVCHGKACMRDTRVMVSVILDNLAAGVGRGELLRNYPSITDEDIQAALSYAAELAREDTMESKSATEIFAEARQRLAGVKILDGRTPDELLGYDEFGLPH